MREFGQRNERTQTESVSERVYMYAWEEEREQMKRNPYFGVTAVTDFVRLCLPFIAHLNI